MDIHDSLHLSLIGVRRGADQSEIETDKNKRQRQYAGDPSPATSFLHCSCHG